MWHFLACIGFILASSAQPEACEGHECSQDFDATSLVQSLRQKAGNNFTAESDSHVDTRRLLSRRADRRQGSPCSLDSTTECKKNEVDPPAFEGCVTSYQCLGVVTEPDIDPASPFANATSNLPNKIAQFLVESAVGALTGGASEFFFAFLTVFWPSSSSAPSTNTMWDTMVKWVEAYVQKQIDKQHVRDLQDTLNGLQNAFLEASQYEACGQLQVGKMNVLDTLMVTLAAEFQDPTIDWQGMSLFTTFVDLHLAIKVFLFRSVTQFDAGVIIRLTNQTLFGPKGYANTAKQFHQSIVAQRVAPDKISVLQRDPHYDSLIACYFDFITSEDTWDPSCGWAINNRIQNVIQCVRGQEYTCISSMSSQLTAEYDSCRTEHVSAVSNSWSDFFVNFLISPAQEWTKLIRNMERDFKAGNQTFQDCKKGLMASSEDTTVYMDQATARTRERYG